MHCISQVAHLEPFKCTFFRVAVLLRSTYWVVLAEKQGLQNFDSRVSSSFHRADGVLESPFVAGSEDTLAAFVKFWVESIQLPRRISEKCIQHADDKEVLFFFVTPTAAIGASNIFKELSQRVRVE